MADLAAERQQEVQSSLIKAREHKEQGNAALKQGNYADALRLYHFVGN